MKNKKSNLLIFAIVVVAVAMLAMTCSGGSEEGGSNKQSKGSGTTTTESTTNQTETKSPASESTTDQTETKSPTTVTKGNIYKKKNLVIDVDKFDDANTAIWFHFENQSNANWTIYASAYSINGIMTNNNMFDLDCEVAKGKKANAKLELDTDFMQDMGMKEIEFVDIKFQVVDSDQYSSFYTDVIRIKTNKFQGKKVVKKGSEIYNKKGIKIEYLQGDGDKYQFAVTNTTGKYMVFDVKNITVNDFTSSETDFDLISIPLFDKQQNIVTLDLSQGFLTDNNIDKVQTIEFTLDVTPNNDFMKAYKTGVAKLTLK